MHFESFNTITYEAPIANPRSVYSFLSDGLIPIIIIEFPLTLIISKIFLKNNGKKQFHKLSKIHFFYPLKMK